MNMATSLFDEWFSGTDLNEQFTGADFDEHNIPSADEGFYTGDSYVSMEVTGAEAMLGFNPTPAVDPTRPKPGLIKK